MLLWNVKWISVYGKLSENTEYWNNQLFEIYKNNKGSDCLKRKFAV